MKKFEGVALHPKQVSPDKTTMVGVWLGRQISPREREILMSLNASSAPGHIGVRINSTSSAVMYLGRIANETTARKMASLLSEAVAAVTGAHIIRQQLPNYMAVSRALAA